MKKGARAEILTIGTELLLGQTIDTNSAYIGEQLAAAGIEVYWKSSVGDHETRIREVLRTALTRSEIVIATGGLGPTEDDLTCRAIAAELSRPLILDQTVLESIRRQFSERRLVMPRNNERQAMIPDGATVLPNLCGTAPGLVIRLGGEKMVVVIPGVPSEMRSMLDAQVIPYLCKTFGVKSRIRSRTLKTCGITESALDETISDLIRLSCNPTIAILAYPGEIHIRLTVKSESETEGDRLLDDLETRIRTRLAEFLFGRDEERLEEVVGRLLLDAKATVAVAESCTGGLVCHRLTNLPGSSAYFIRGEVVYSNEAKERLLGVPRELMAEHGAVSRPVALAMAVGMRQVAGTDLALGITGIAGPGGGTATKPVGLTYIALASGDGATCCEYRFLADRDTNKLFASQKALDILRRHLLSLRYVGQI
ncbi:competence/damage-inducible protein A [Candidatus Methylomirabilis sp.]|uniref:CinA-like protein n=1 Tax=Candidatus Methylomirabilis tolerans TaxID=3123416 RepID=A0AAJ1AG73_9BACT|nr:competence/damage-inducible protein A [Candidatus Methylomirabilis sp.]